MTFMRLLPALMLFAAVLPSAHANTTGLKSHPCVLVNAEGLPALREKCRDEAANRFGFKSAGAWAAVKQRADQLAAAPTYRYKVNCPGENNVTLDVFEYTLSDQNPPRHDNSPAYPPWTAMFQERNDSITTRLVHFSFAYLVTGEQKYFDKAREIALHLAHWDQWTDPSYGAGKLVCCLDTGHCTYAMGMFYDWCFDKLSVQERNQVREAIINKGILPSLAGVDRYAPDTNGYAVIVSGAGLAALAVRPEELRAGEWLQACLDKTVVSLDRGGKDGGAFEGPMYGTYLLDSFALFFDGLVSARVEHKLFEHPYLATMDRYCIGLLSPDTKQIPCFSDGSPGVAVPKLMNILAQRGSTDAAWYLQQISAIEPETIYDFIRFDAGKLKPAQPTWIPSTVFYDIGHASLRDGFNAKAPTLYLKSGPYTNNIGHNHYDHNSFVISYGGQWIIPDRGYHNFYVPEKRKFSLGSLGHCTITIDTDEAYFGNHKVPYPGCEQVKRTGGRIVDFFGGKRFDFAKGEAAEPYNSDKLKVLDRFDRSIVYLKPHMFIIRDQLEAPTPHRYNFMLHTDGNGEIVQQGDLFFANRGNGQVLTRITSPAKLAPHIQTYPGAESYGQFLRMETEPVAKTSFLTVLYPRPAVSENYLRNGGFEKGLSGWTPRAGEDAPNHKIETSGMAEGKQCASIENSGYYYSEKFGLPAGTTLTARAQVKTTTMPAGKGASMTFHFWKGGKAFANKRTGPLADAAWTQQELVTKVPDGTEQISLALEFAEPGTAWFDDVRLTTDFPLPEVLTPTIKPLGSEAVDVAVGPDRFLVTFGTAGEVRKVGEMETDAELLVVTLDRAGKPVRVFVNKGTYALYQGRQLVRTEKPAAAETDL